MSVEHNDGEFARQKKSGKLHNILPIWGNEATMNLNPLILANIQGSSYFKVHLFKLKTYHEVVDEIYYQVKHLEPWERGSRKTAGQTGMCGGVRGVGAGGIVSTAFCLLYKLYTLRLTRKQVNGLLGHTDSPYIRALGFMYIRYTQPPGDLYDWYEDYLLDEEEIDVKAGGGQLITIGQLAHQFLTKLDWFSTLFPRIPVPIQKQIETKLNNYCQMNKVNFHHMHKQFAKAKQATFSGGNSVNSDNATTGRSFQKYNRERESDRDSRPYSDRRNREERESYERDRGVKEYNHRENKRDDRYDSSRSRHRDKHDSRDSKDKHKSRYRSRSRSYERGGRRNDSEYYTNKT